VRISSAVGTGAAAGVDVDDADDVDGAVGVDVGVDAGVDVGVDAAIGVDDTVCVDAEVEPCSVGLPDIVSGAAFCAVTSNPAPDEVGDVVVSAEPGVYVPVIIPVSGAKVSSPW